jgi:hypothetical protein
MRDRGNSWAELFPLQFRVLYRQFLLRIVDLEALSIQADIPRFLGQFSGVFILFSLIQGLGVLIHPVMTPKSLLSLLWYTEQSMTSSTMLVTGLIAVMGWDNIFPDLRDLMALSPLPVHPRTILFAKMAACGAVVGLGVLTLNFATSIALALVVGGIARFAHQQPAVVAEVDFHHAND